MPLTEEQLLRTLEGTDDAVATPPPAPPTPQPKDENTPPAAEPPAPAPADNKTEPPAPAAPVFNFDEELVKTTGGAIKTKDELVALQERANKAAELETQLSNYNELKAKAEANPFANDFTKKLNELYAAGAPQEKVDAFIALNKVEIDNLSPLDAMAMALQMRHGITLDQAKEYLNEKYELSTDPEAKMDTKTEIAIKIDSTADRDYLKTYKAEVSAVPANQQEVQNQLLQEQYNQQIQKLSPIANSVATEVPLNSFKGVNINGKEGDGALTTDLPLSEESKATIAKAVNDMVASNWNGLTPDDKGKQAVKTFAENVMVLQNWRNWLIDVASKTEMRVRAEYNNADPIHRGNEAPPVGKTKAQQRQEGIMKTLQEAEYID